MSLLYFLYVTRIIGKYKTGCAIVFYIFSFKNNKAKGRGWDFG
jgi:hypothetical protein